MAGDLVDCAILNLALSLIVFLPFSVLLRKKGNILVLCVLCAIAFVYIMTRIPIFVSSNAWIPLIESFAVGAFVR